MPRPTPTRPAAEPSPPAWRTAATVLLMLHLFALGMGLAVNAGGGKSLLAPALHRIPLVRSYLKLLWMDVGYEFLATSPVPEDGVHRLELTAAPGTADADAKMLPAELPPAGMQPRIRRQRYQWLAYNVASLDEVYAENSDVRTELPLAIAERWLRDLGAPHQSYLLTCWREPSGRLPKALERAAPTRPREGGPRTSGPAVFEPVDITVRLVWDPEESRYQGSRAEPDDQTSQVVGDGAAIETTTDATPPSGDAASAIVPGDANDTTSAE